MDGADERCSTPVGYPSPVHGGGQAATHPPQQPPAHLWPRHRGGGHEPPGPGLRCPPGHLQGRPVPGGSRRRPSPVTGSVIASRCTAGRPGRPSFSWRRPTSGWSRPDRSRTWRIPVDQAARVCGDGRAGRRDRPAHLSGPLRRVRDPLRARNDPWALAGAIADLARDPPAAAAQAAEASRQARPTPGPSRRTGTWPLSGNSWRAVDSGRRRGVAQPGSAPLWEQEAGGSNPPAPTTAEDHHRTMPPAEPTRQPTGELLVPVAPTSTGHRRSAASTSAAPSWDSSSRRRCSGLWPSRSSSTHPGRSSSARSGWGGAGTVHRREVPDDAPQRGRAPTPGPHPGAADGRGADRGHDLGAHRRRPARDPDRRRVSDARTSTSSRSS